MSLGRVLRERVRTALPFARGAPTGGRRRRARTWVFALLASGMAVVSWAALRALFGALAAAGADGTQLSGVLGMLLTGATLALVALDLDVAVATLLLDPDLALLRRAPLPPASLLALKLVDAFPRTVLPLAILALPAAIAYLGVVHAHGAAAIAVLLLLAPLWTIALALGIAVVLPFVASVPAARAREALGLLATLTLTVLWLVNALYLPRVAEAGGEPLARVLWLATHRPAWLAATPGPLAAAALEALALGNAGVASRAIGALALESLGALGLAALSARAFLPRVLDAIAAPAPRRGGRRRANAAPAPRATPLLAAVLARDARLLVRDWPVFADVLAAAVLWTLIPLVSRLVLEVRSAALARAMLATLAVGLGYEIGARALPFERRAATWMRLAPVAPLRWLGARFASAAIMAGTLLLIAWATISRLLGLPAGEALAVLAFGAAVTLLSLAVGLWTGVRFGNPRWTTPRAMLTLSGRLVAGGVMIVQIAAWLGLGAFASGADPSLGGWPVAAVAAGFSVVAGGLVLEATRRRIARLDWYG